MQIGMVIKKARLEKKITQEELAESLGVTTQAVSRWETSVSYPDITLIPSIANYLDITSDELLGIKLEERKQNIDKILKENNELSDKYHLDESLKLLKEALKKYPNDERLLDALTRCYWNRMLMTIDKEEMFDYRQKLKKLIIESALKTLGVAKDSNIIENATLTLINIYPRTGEEGRQKALEIVNTLPSIHYSKELKLINVLTGEDRKHQLQANMLLGLEIINKHFSYRICEYFDDIDKQITLFKKNIEVIKIMIGDNLYWYNIPCSNYAFKIAELYAQKQDKENTIRYLNESADYAESIFNIPKIGEYDSFWLDGLKYQISKTVNLEGNYRTFENTIFDFIRDDNRFIEVKNRYLLINEKKICD